jgi:hypothetical protein
MTEAEWLASTNPEALLAFLRRRPPQRKLRLFACACCRQVWDRLLDPRSRAAVEAAEQFADGLIDADALARARKEAWHCSSSESPHPPTAAWQAARPVFSQRGSKQLLPSGGRATRAPFQFAEGLLNACRRAGGFA